MNSIDLNCDLGESYGKMTSQYDEIIMPYLSSCNIACGFHSGDPVTIERTIQMAIDHNVAIGAHPSFPDLQGFGRRVMHIPPTELTAIIRYQIAALKGMTNALGGTLHHVKPHGALYNFAAKNEAAAQAIIDAIKSIDQQLIVYGLPGSFLEKQAKKANQFFAKEAFADRRYERDGSLRARTHEGAVIEQENEVLAQVKMMVTEKQIKTHNGEIIPLQADTICLHSDTQGAAKLARQIHEMLTSNAIKIHPIKRS